MHSGDVSPSTLMASATSRPLVLIARFTCGFLINSRPVHQWRKLN
ncbi:hypothetical protein QWZ16_18285 [Vibrio ostreicida]|uniref:Uncharacterized protein n=1 Tax=Vibrio ostreicida TaxID=526588 RepID=A0ABT8BWP5_9VIBR|nr:hypothetical protein [Vibrio ostreicida]MDN3611550.1 hypothetical protein [Vibrio ostreicida]